VSPHVPGARPVNPDAEAERLIKERSKPATIVLRHGDEVLLSTHAGPVRARIGTVEVAGSQVRIHAERTDD
jgi:hypothetical protein